MHRPHLVAAVVLAVVARVAAQDPQQVLADFKQQCKEALASYKANLAAIANELDAKIATFKLAFDDLAVSDAPVEDVVDALATFQHESAGLQKDTDVAILSSAKTALVQLTAGGPDESVFPTGLLCGKGGTLDDSLAAARKLAVKAYAAANKQLVKLTKQLRKQTDMRLEATLRPVQRFAGPPSPTGFFGFPEHDLAVDLVATFNRGGDDDDGRAWFEGTANPDHGLVSWLFGNDAHGVSGTTIADPFHRWFAATDPGASLPEGNYAAQAGQGAGSLALETVGMP